MRRRIGRWIVLAMWLAALPCAALSESLLCVAANGVAALLDYDGRPIVAPGAYADVFCVVEGSRYAVGVESNGEMRYALCDETGRLLTDFCYGMFEAFDGGILFREDGYFGAMDENGSVTVEAAYTQLTATGENRFLALCTDPYDDEPDEIWRVVPGEEPTATGVTTTIGLSAVDSDRMPFRSPTMEKCGYVSGDGTVAIAAKLTYAGAFEDGLARAAREGRFGLLQANGEWRIEPDYLFLEVGDGVVAAMPDDQTCIVFGMEDGQERFRVAGKNLETGLLGAMLAAVDDESLRIYDAEGVLLLETDRSHTVSRGAGGQMILRMGEWGAACVGVVDENGALQPRRDQHLLPLEEDRYLFMTMNVAAYNSGALGEIRYSCNYESRRFGVMTAAGEEILPATATEIQLLAKGRYLTISQDGLRVVDGEGRLLWSHLTETE